MKNKYLNPELEIILLGEDIITTSGEFRDTTKNGEDDNTKGVNPFG